MEAIVKVALAMVAKGKNRWAKVDGPGAALVMTCIRIGWQVVSARHLVTHEGEMLDLKLDPPAVVLLKVADGVRRWRWKKIEKICPQLAVNGSGRGAVMEPLWQLLGTKVADKDWNERHNAGLRSAASGRQFTQSRVKLCGWAFHDRCLVCLNNIVEKESPYEGEKKRTVRDMVEATDDQLRRAPVGDLSHRIWSGECLEELRVGKA